MGEQEEVFYEQPAVTLKRMRELEQVAESEVAALEAMLASHSQPNSPSTLGAERLILRPCLRQLISGAN